MSYCVLRGKIHNKKGSIDCSSLSYTCEWCTRIVCRYHGSQINVVHCYGTVCDECRSIKNVVQINDIMTIAHCSDTGNMWDIITDQYTSITTKAAK